MELPRVAAEHPTLTSTALDTIVVLRELPSLIHPAAGAASWMQHHDFAERTQDLADHLRAALVLAESGLFPSALAVTRTALEHHLLDRLVLLADRYEETITPEDSAKIDQWEQEFAIKSEAWTHDVTSFTRTKDRRRAKVVRMGYAVTDDAGNVNERVSPYWVALERYDPFTGHPDHQASTARPFSTVEQVEAWARENQQLYSAFLRWGSICSNLQLSTLVRPDELLHLHVHYIFLSAFAHGTNGRRHAMVRGRMDGPSLGHVLGELVLLYTIAIGLAEIRSWDTFIERRPQLLTPLDDPVRLQLATAESVIDYFWFLGGSPQPFDRYEEANRRAHPLLMAGQRATIDPDTIADSEVGYYSNPIDRLTRMHMGENEMSTGFGFRPAWPTLHW